MGNLQPYELEVDIDFEAIGGFDELKARAFAGQTSNDFYLSFLKFWDESRQMFVLGACRI